MSGIPIKPSEVQDTLQIPPIVIDTINELIKMRMRNGYVDIPQSTIVEELVKRGLSQDDIFRNHWLDFESIYRNAGWEVIYDIPERGDSYESHVVFRKH
jgi:hypothetical protein